MEYFLSWQQILYKSLCVISLRPYLIHQPKNHNNRSFGAVHLINNNNGRIWLPLVFSLYFLASSGPSFHLVFRLRRNSKLRQRTMRPRLTFITKPRCFPRPVFINWWDASRLEMFKKNWKLIFKMIWLFVN